jgi:PIN domain nuclease of toxin-antitoxin system
LLLDSHAFLWAITRPSELAVAARRAIEDSQNQCFVSIASLWEMTIKRSTGKLALPSNYADGVEHIGAALLSITISHVRRVQTLPFHHRDPFDRMLVAQAMEEGLTLMSRDRHIKLYGVPMLPA